jgi:O-antigen/teichoic acid export membrane protein
MNPTRNEPMAGTGASSTIIADPAAQARTVLIWKSIEYLGLALFLLSVPRLMGPEFYGRFAVLNATLQILTMLSGLGAVLTFGRFMPEYAAQGLERVRVLFMQVLLLRMTVALLLGVLLVFSLPKLLPEATLLTRVGLAGALFTAAIASTCFNVFYGLNQLGRWLTIGSSKHLVLIGMLALIGSWASLERAGLALLAAELVMLGLGAYWARGFFALRREVFELRQLFGHLRFSLPFFATNLALMLVWRAGELTVMGFTGDPVEVAYFSVAASVAAAVSALLGQLAMMIIPHVTAMELSDEAARGEYVLGLTLKYLTIAGTLVALSVYAMDAELVSTLVGEGYAPVLSGLRVMVITLIPIAFVRIAISSAVARSQPQRAAFLGAGLLVTFIVAAALLVPDNGSRGAALALVAAMMGAGAVGYTQLSAPVRVTARTFRLLISSFTAAAVIAQAESAPLWGKLLLTAGYLVSLPLIGLLSLDELARLARAITGRALRRPPG